MIRTSGNLVIPIVTWAPTPPIHKISCILASDDGGDVVTGGSDGNMILWRVGEDYKFTARWMVTGHRASVLHLCTAGSRSDEGSCLFFSHSASNEMALWNWQDGKCMEFKIDTRHQHTTIKSHQPSFLEYRLLFCCGRYPHIAVLHAMSLSVLFTLASQAHSDWISSFTVFTHPNQKRMCTIELHPNDEIVLGISFSSMVTLWTLNGEEVQGEANYEHESRAIQCSSTVLQVHCCPHTPRCILMITSSGWQLLDAMTCSVFWSQPGPSNDSLVSGRFAGSNVLVLYCRSGTALLYRITPRLVTASQGGSSSSLCTDPPALLAQLSSRTVSLQTDPSKPHSGYQTSTTNERGLCCFFLSESCITRPILFGGTDWGTVLSWRLDPFLAAMDSDQLPNTFQSPSLITPTSYCDLSDVWRRCSPLRPLDLWEKDHRIPNAYPHTDQDIITVCVQLLQMTCSRLQKKTVVHTDRLAFGLSSGRIIVVRLTDFLQVVYNHQTGENSGLTGLLRLSRLSLDGHEGPVTCMLHPASVDDQYIRSLTEENEEKGITNTTPQFNPDHLLSGGADFTVRLWDLDPWRDIQNERGLRGSVGDCSATDSIANAPACLAVFRCHASPCLALSIGPPSNAVLQAAAGNPRLGACVCSIGGDGSVSVISLREQRVLLSTTPCSGVSGSPVNALGWRIPEDMLFVAHADGLLEVWDITVGCLDRLETDSNARDLFEQAHYVVEVQSSSVSFDASLSQLSYQSAAVGAHYTRTNTLVFAGCVNNSHAAGSVLYTAPARLRRAALMRRSTSSRQHMPAVLLQTIGVTNTNPAHSLSAGPAAFVFHWDTEAMISNLQMENAAIVGSTDKYTMNSSDSNDVSSGLRCTTLVKQLQLFVSSVHPWGLDLEADHAALACLVGFSDRMRSGTIKSNNMPLIRENICLGLPSKHGCVTLCLPGWFSSEVGRSVSHLYSLSHGISTNLMLAELSICETLTSLDTECAEQLLQLSGPSNGNPLSLIVGDSGETNTVRTELACVRAGWLHLAARLCGPLLAQCIWGSPQLHATEACRLPELEVLVQKWQDRMIPIRYAARTLLFAYLDHMGYATRQALVNKWSNLLPLFAMTQLSKPSATPSTPGEVQSVNGSPAVPRSNLIPERKCSLQAQPLTETPLDRRMSVDFANGSLPSSKPTSPLRSMHRQSTAPGLPACLPSVSLCSLESAGLVSHSVTDSHWWLTLSGYRVSPREHARLQAVAVVLLGAIGTRFGTAVCRRHPAVCARDLIDESKPFYQSAAQVDGNPGGTALSRNPGLASPCFASPDNPNHSGQKARSGIGADTLSIESFAPATDYLRADEIPEGFGYDNHQLARSTCQCLVTLLLNRAPMLDTSHSTGDPHHQVSDAGTANRILHTSTERQPLTSPPSQSSAATANALVSLLMSNMHSSLRRASIDLLGRGFVVWEPFVDLGQLLNALLSLVVDAESQLSDLALWQPIPERADLARTAREALWAIAFARPKSVILVLSLEVRRHGAQINAAASAFTTSQAPPQASPITPSIGPTVSDHLNTSGTGDLSTNLPATRGNSSTLTSSPSLPNSPRMMVMMASPAVTASVFAPQPSSAPSIPNANSKLATGPGPCPPMFAARDELVRLFEQLCVRRATDVVSVLPEIVEVTLACLDRTRLKERGLDFVFPALRQFSAFSSHTRMQKACVGGVNGSLTFFDFKIGRFFVTPAHKGPVTAVRFHSDGRLVATYSLQESTLRIWQLHSSGFFGMGGQQVKPVSTHPVPPLIPPPKHVSGAAQNASQDTRKDSSVKADCISFDPISVWLDWPEARVVHLITDGGVKRRVNL
ncbi:WD repeat-containing protein 7 [Fasciola hepatica]|uniref:WD repeat-containing protein 7 n=1 Tax=Fasciola hepatica TaxID=6192 RepID=A0A4E0RQU8_FASHE|nr:WD repeat-containing protein 7 [Fasciola hepatica]